jgi:hypothetical protein
MRRNVKYLIQDATSRPSKSRARLVKSVKPSMIYRKLPLVLKGTKGILYNNGVFEKFLRKTKRSPRFTTEYSFADTNAVYNKQILQASKMVRVFQKGVTPVGAELLRFVMYKVLFRSLRTYLISGLKRFFKRHPLSTINTIFVCSSPTSANAEFIARYVAARLRNRFPINRLISLVLAQMTRLLNTAQIVGFKIACSGRFERRGRASYI